MATRHARNDLLVIQMVIMEGYRSIIFQQSMHFGKDFFRLIKFVEDIVDEDKVYAFIGKTGVSIRKNRLYVFQSLALRTAFDAFNGHGMDIQGVDLAFFADELSCGQGIASRAAAEIENCVASFDVGFLKHFPGRFERIADLQGQCHEPEMCIC